MAKTTSDAAPGGAAPIKYEYMFGADKSPTEQLDALLRAIAKYIVSVFSSPGTVDVC